MLTRSLRWTQFFALASLLGFVGNIAAQSRLPDVSLSGFGTLGFAILDHPAVEFQTGVAVDGADDRGSFEVDTRLGLQLDAVFNTAFSSTFQTIVREGEDGDVGIGLELGFLRWLVTDNTAIRAGRMSLPVYSTSDYREVGYASPYLRPSADLYAMIPLRRFDGVDAIFDHEWRGALFSWQLAGGRSHEIIYNELEIDANQLFGISMTVEKGPARIRISHSEAQVVVDTEGLNFGVTAIREGIAQTVEQIPQLDSVLGTVAEDFTGERAPLSFDTVALSLEFPRFFVDAEYTRRRVDSWVSNADGWLLALGAKFGKLQPYIHVSELSEKDGDRRIVLPDVPVLQQLEEGINIFYFPQDQRTVGVGARYDISPDIAFKAQVDRISRDELGISFARPSEDEIDLGEDLTLLSVVMDFVF